MFKKKKNVDICHLLSSQCVWRRRGPVPTAVATECHYGGVPCCGRPLARPLHLQHPLQKALP